MHLSFLCACLVALLGCASGAAGNSADSALEHAEVMSLDTPIHVHLFSTSDTDLGAGSTRDTARAMLKSAPHLLAVDVVDRLRQAGFTRVTLDESDGDPASDALTLVGRFTVLHPGSQGLRMWIGFGAGKSKVCVEGRLVDADGQELTDFSLCRSGLGWGSSAPQLEGESADLGLSIAELLIDWSKAGD